MCYVHAFLPFQKCLFSRSHHPSLSLFPFSIHPSLHYYRFVGSRACHRVSPANTRTRLQPCQPWLLRERSEAASRRHESRGNCDNEWKFDTGEATVKGSESLEGHWWKLDQRRDTVVSRWAKYSVYQVWILRNIVLLVPEDYCKRSFFTMQTFLFLCYTFWSSWGWSFNRHDHYLNPLPLQKKVVLSTFVIPVTLTSLVTNRESLSTKQNNYALRRTRASFRVSVWAAAVHNNVEQRNGSSVKTRK